MKRFIRRNRGLSLISGVSLIIVLLYYAIGDLIKISPSVANWILLFINLCTGLLINFSFYVFQIYIPTIKKEAKSLLVIAPQLKMLLEELETLILVANKYIKGIETGLVRIEKSIVYFMYVEDINAKTGWARKFDFNSDLSKIIRKK